MSHEPHRITEPLIVPASLDPDAVKILNRLRRYGHEAYLVGGCVRDLSLGRIPKDFDIATSARPRQVKRLFRNSRIIGRRFKLVHIQFGDKIIEVSTFRRSPGQSELDGPLEADDELAEDLDDLEDTDLMIRRDNVFGTAEEDAVRRDFTINALFYDLEENEVLDFVGGAADLDDRLVRTIGDPNIRFREDPVRILRAIRFAARLDFDIEEDAFAAMVRYHADLSKCPPPRITEELIKILSCGASRRALELLDETGALRIVLPEIAEFLEASPRIEGWSEDVHAQLVRYLDVVDSLDRGRRVLSNAVMLTVLLHGPIRQHAGPTGDPAQFADVVVRPFAARMSISRRDAFRVKQILIAQPRLRGEEPGRRRRRARPHELVRREYFRDALEFLRIETEVFDLPRDDLDRWTELYYAELRRGNPKEYRRALREAPFGGVPPQDDDTPAPPDDETEETSVDRNRRRRTPREDGADDTRDSDEEGEEARPRRRRGGRRSKKRGGGADQARAEGADRGDGGGESERPADRDVKKDAKEEVASGRRRRRKKEGASDERKEGSEGKERSERGERGERKERGERSERSDERSERSDERGERSDERSERGAREDGPEGDEDGPKRSKRSRRRGRRGRRDAAEVREDAREDRGREQEDRDEGRGEASSKRGRRGRRRSGEKKRDESGRGAGRQAKRDEDDDRRRRGGRRGRKDRSKVDGGAGGQRLEFDEIRAGPLKPPEPGDVLEDVDEGEEIEVRWDDPLPTVGDPGPISVIRTGIDQTEKSSSRRARKKKDPAKRELAKEILDQPSLQALKMSEGDPRGHEVTRPRVLRRAERERREADQSPPPRERPFDPIEDFESIETLFRW